MHAIVLMTAMLFSTPVAQQPAPTANAPVHTGDTVESLVGMYRVLQTHLKTKMLFDIDTIREIDQLRKRAAAFNQANPGNVQILAMELQLSIYRRDRSRAEELFEKMRSIRGDDEQLQLAYAQYLKDNNQYLRAVEILDNANLAGDSAARGNLIRAACQIALNHFDAADRSLSAEVVTTTSRSDISTEAARLRQTLSAMQGLWPREVEARQADAAKDDLPRVEFQTSRGNILLELYEDQAPSTVNNFVALVMQGFYDGTKFHVVIPNQYAIGGDPNTRPDGTGRPGTGDPGYRIPDEYARSDRRDHFGGVISMENPQGPNSAGSIFAIMFEPNAARNGRNTAFGRVVEGMDVLLSLEANDEILSAKVLRKRDHDYTATRFSETPATLPASPAASQDAKD